MIKVNLLSNLGLQPAGGGGLSGGEIITVDIRRQAGIKILVILIMPILLYAYEQFNISVLQSELQKLQQEVAQVDQAKAGFGSAAPRVEKYTKEKKDIEKQVDVVRAIAKNRLREVKTLDALQSLVPANTWFKEIEIDAGTVKLQGYTTSEDGVSELIRALDNSVFFSKVVPKSAIQVELPTGSAKKFELEFKVGKQQE